jgi:hypothetical protein
MKISLYHYISMGILIFNAGIFIGGIIVGRKAYRTIIDNHLKHMKDTLQQIKDKVCANDNRIDGHAERLATLEERTK